MIRLVSPVWLLLGLLLLIPLLVRRRRVWSFSNLGLLPANPRPAFRSLVVMGLLGTSLTALILALGRPQSVSQQTVRRVEGRDILLVLDLSLSMEGYLPAAVGQPPQARKLDVMQDAAMTFVDRHPHDRLGLIVFGDLAFGAWPLSTDHTTLKDRLQRLDDLLTPELRGTHMPRALTAALDHMQELGQARTRLVLMLTDGLDTIAEASRRRLVRRLRQEGIRLYVLGIQLPDNGPLTQLVTEGEGRYFDVQDTDDLNAALQAIERLETSPIHVTSDTEARELYAYVALPGFVCLFGVRLCQALWVIDV